MQNGNIYAVQTGKGTCAKKGVLGIKIQVAVLV